MHEVTLFGIKPDTFIPNMPRDTLNILRTPLPHDPEIFIEEIREALRQYGGTILQERRYTISPEVAEKHYEEHRGIWDEKHACFKLDFLIHYLSSGQSHWIVVSGEDIIRKGRIILTSIREKYLVDRTTAWYNMTHASDSPESSAREIALHFPEFFLPLS